MSTYRALRKKQRQTRTIAIIAATIAILAMLQLVHTSSYWQGYNEGYNTGTADGWQGCIEENNLYNRY